MMFDWRKPVLALQFLTRLPTPQIRDFQPSLLAAAAPWFPVVGLLIGAFLSALVYWSSWIDPWLAALVGFLLWTWITGGLHLDGLADMSDGLGAAHRDPTRFLAVLKDPHLGSFGVLALIAQSAAKLVLLMLLAKQGAWLSLLLIPAWARLGVLYWSCLPALAPGMAEQFAWQKSSWSLYIILALLLAASYFLASPLLAAPLLIWAYAKWLMHKLGGMTGDCLGAGIEITETGLLCCAVLLKPFLLF
ncbi:adenosylcobinamide-GDP ribazoletransferase [Iodobacter fluviatilis]|jgi:adenosylcobinamide-GDP ribazoletransferase|uniref:Adenosylcobinamide-GDP ribazoletransferase n=1 Tax=Iodobacter fluviatilis TaxID=537 RepID=A0A7G3G983_9NEIS|nr:adenosylcobinamide-GDP ribazoletransferase [Iodobacter fluviatilis]QBC43613.1 adenosylcobinamide-GDP ribazoletransferase [Iodobacter fluviatilis]